MHRSAVALPLCFVLAAAAGASAPGEALAQSVTTTVTYGWTGSDGWSGRRWWRGQSGALAIIADVTPSNSTTAAAAGIVWQINPWVIGVGPGYGGFGAGNSGTLAIVGSGPVAVPAGASPGPSPAPSSIKVIEAPRSK